MTILHAREPNATPFAVSKGNPWLRSARPWGILAAVLALVLASSSHALAPGATWSPLAPLSTARDSHTATLLPNGKVLVTGGEGASGRLASAELYDPATGTWSSTGSLATGRKDHTATLLPNGKVLVVAGAGPSGSLGSAELYDPASGIWSSAGALVQVRYNHTATLLPNGKVLVVGGWGLSGPLGSAELYDPASGTWSSAGALAQARTLHTAALLPNGKVLVTGGDGASGSLGSAELYDPATGAWSSTGSLAQARTLHTATLLPNGKVLVAGGASATGSLGSAELYDPATGSWSAAGGLAQRRAGHTATLLPLGRVLVTGGDDTSGRLLRAETYDPATNAWAPAPSLNQARALHTATLLPNGKVLALGGLGSTSGLSSAEQYDPAASAWVSGSPVPFGRWGHAATLLSNGKVLVVSGAGGSGYLARAELYDPATGSWSSTGSLAQGRYFHTVTLLRSGKVLVVGGDGSNGTIAAAELYDPATGFWSSAGSLAQARSYHTATLLPDGKVLVAGGQNSVSRFASAELYDPATNSWTATGSMPQARASHTATLLPNGKVLAAGGYNGSTAIPNAALYDPSTGTWTATGSLALARYLHTATLLPNGKVLAVAGTGTTGSQSNAELYDPATGTWSTTGPLADSHFGHTATLLLSGKVLVASGGTIVRATEVYDPATGVWTEAGATSTARYYHTATLLPSGQVMITGGYNYLSSTEVYEDTGSNPAWRPVISSVSPSGSLEVGSPLTVSGSLLRGISEASGGNGRSSPTDFPLLTLREIETGRVFTPALQDFSRTQVTATVPVAPTGEYLLTVSVNGLFTSQGVHLVADLTAPQTLITSAPASVTAATSATFAFSASEPGATFECKLDGASLFTPCTSPAIYVSLAEGTHLFQVRARDAAGNADASPASHSWQVDTTPPDTTLTAVPNDPSNTATATFTFSASEAGASFECSLDGSAFSPCAPPFTYSSLAEGSHTFRVRARDAAGNVDPTSASYTWRVVTTLPDTTLTVSMDGNSITFTFSSTVAGSTFECTLDGTVFPSCISPLTFNKASFPEGPHLFQVRAIDTAGNRDPSPASYSWLVDLTAPETTLGSTPPSSTNATSATFTFSANEASASFECSLDGSAFASCTSPTTYAALAEGSHLFRVRALDTAGNVDATPASYSWLVDTTAPETTLTSTPPNPTNANSATFTFSSSEPGVSFECKLDGAAVFTSCTSPAVYFELSGGSHTFQVRARDAAGNGDASPASYSWLVDLTTPETTLLSSPPAFTSSASATFTFSSPEAGASFECSLDGGAFSSCTSPTSYASLAEGTHVFQVRARDAVGNVDPTPASHSWRVDMTPPETTILSASSNGASITFTFSSNEAGATFVCGLDGGVSSSCTSPATYALLAEGGHTFRVAARDAAGNMDASPALYSWVVDLTAPETTLTASTPSGTSITFTFSSPEAGASFECSLDGAAFASCSSPATYASLADGSHSFRVRAIDASGNVDPSPALYSWAVDLTAPETILSSAPTSPTRQADATFGFGANEAGASFECSLDGVAFSPCTSPMAYASLIEGSHTFRVRARDAAGNADATPASHTWLIDLTAPAAPVITSPTHGATLEDSTPVLSGTAQPGSTVTVTLDGSVAGTVAANAAGAWSFAIARALADGQHTVTATASDTGGTSPSSPAVSFTIDTPSDTPAPPTPPTEGCGCGAGSGDASWLVTGLVLLAGLASRRRRILG